MQGLEAEKKLCFGFRELVRSGQVLDAVYITLALGLRKVCHELIYGKAALGGVASFASDDDIVHAAFTTQGTWNDVVIGDSLDGERSPAIDAAAAGFLCEDAEGTRGLLVLFNGFPAPKKREILQKEPRFIPADSAPQEGFLHTIPVCKTFAEAQRAGIFRNAQLVFVPDAVATDDGPSLYAGVLAGTAGQDPGHGPVLDLLPLAAAEITLPGALLEQQILLLFLSEGAFVVPDIAGTVRPGHRLLDGRQPDFRPAVGVGVEDLGDVEDETVAVHTVWIQEVGHLLHVQLLKDLCFFLETGHQIIEIIFRKAHKRALLRQRDDHHPRTYLRMLAAFVIQQEHITGMGTHRTGQRVALLHYLRDGPVRDDHVRPDHELERGLLVGLVLLDAALRDHCQDVQRTGAGDFRGDYHLIVQHITHLQDQRLLQCDVLGIEVLARQRVTRRLQLREDVPENVFYRDVEVKFEGEVHGNIDGLNACESPFRLYWLQTGVFLHWPH